MNQVDKAKYVLLAWLATEVDSLTLGENLVADNAEYQADDTVAIGVSVEADPRRFFGSGRVGYAAAEIQAVSKTRDGVDSVADTMMALHGWAQPSDQPLDAQTLPSTYPAASTLRSVIRGMFLQQTRTDENEDTGAFTRSYQYSILLEG